MRRLKETQSRPGWHLYIAFSFLQRNRRSECSMHCMGKRNM